MVWSAFVELWVKLLVSMTAACGGSVGWAIVALSVAVRLSLMPWALAAARRSRERQVALDAIRPELERVRQRYAGDPMALARETSAVHARAGVPQLDTRGLLGSLAQLPIVGGVYAAVRQGVAAGGRFLWIGDLAKPDAALALGVCALTALVSAINPSVGQQSRWMAILLPTVFTAFIAWRLASGLGLYWAASSAVSIGQAAYLRARFPGRRAAIR